ncbi:hypothetical protein [Halospeciosus flavus]
MTEATPMDVSLDAFSLPLAAPLSTAAGDITERRGYLLQVECAERG